MEIDKQQIRMTYKSKDTEEHIDMYFNRPIGYAWARLFKHFGIHPNVVTFMSMILGAAAGCMFYYPDFAHNIAGVLLLMWANFYDSCDGQLARMTGKQTEWGRVLDGFAGDVWFFFIYFAIFFRVFNQTIPFTDIRFGWGFLVFGMLDGYFCHACQSRLADYYRNIHLFFVPGATSELATSARQQKVLDDTPKKGNFLWRFALLNYVSYTKAQEKATPEFQKLLKYVLKKYDGKPNEAFRQEFRRRSLPLMKYTNILTFNWRAITIYVTCLLNVPWAYIVIEAVVSTSIYLYMRHEHESMSKDMLRRLQNGDFDTAEACTDGKPGLTEA